jgi:hypothetical protein
MRKKVYTIPNSLHSRHTPEKCNIDVVILNIRKEGNWQGLKIDMSDYYCEKIIDSEPIMEGMSLF